MANLNEVFDKLTIDEFSKNKFGMDNYEMLSKKDKFKMNQGLGAKMREDAKFGMSKSKFGMKEDAKFGMSKSKFGMKENAKFGMSKSKFGMIEEDFSHDFNLEWEHDDAAEYVHKFSEICGNDPNILSTEEKGIAIWYPDETTSYKLDGIDERLPNIFIEHWCRDESIIHHCPSEHVDYFYSAINIKLDKDKWPDVLSVSGSVGYDPLKHSLYARCASIEANIATLFTCVNVNQGNISKSDLDNNETYGKNINKMSNPKNVLEMYKYLINYLRDNSGLKLVPMTGYWEVAFPNFVSPGNCYGKT